MSVFCYNYEIIGILDIILIKTGVELNSKHDWLSFKELYIINVNSGSGTIEKYDEEEIIQDKLWECIKNVEYDCIVNTKKAGEIRMFYKKETNEYYIFCNIDFESINFLDKNLYYRNSKKHMFDIARVLYPDAVINNIEIFI